MFVGQWDCSYCTVLCIHNTKSDKVGKEENLAQHIMVSDPIHLM